MELLAERIAAVGERIAAAARSAGRSPGDIRLVAVTKTHPPEVVAQALACGLTDLGENRVQEAEAKIAALAGQATRPTWHLIGHLQSNKARRAAQLFDMIQSVDSLRLAEALSRHAGALRSAPLGILLQVNLSGETSKEGFDLAGWEARPGALDTFLAQAEQIVELPDLQVRGLMTIAPLRSSPEAARPCFRSARLLGELLAQRLPRGDWSQLSMGMTDDYAVAISEGATIVRVGRAIFGAR